MEFLPFTRPTIDETTIQSVVQVLRSGWLATGPKVTELENALARYLGHTQHQDVYVKLVTSATGGLEIALRAMGVGPGDEVIVPAMTFAASANVVKLCGATPVLIDVDLGTRNIQIETIKKAITPRTKVIMPVHFAGLPVDLDPLYELANEENIRVLEDAAHAIGSLYKGRKIGSFGDVISFSFHPNKNMTTIEGGALVLKDKKEAEIIDLYRFHGLQKDNLGNMDVIMASGKFNMPDVSAAVGLGQLQRLDEFNHKRKDLAQLYFEYLKEDDLLTLPARGDDGHSWHIFAPLIRFDRLGMTRPDFIKKMAEHKIGVGVHYPAVHTFSAYKELGYKEGQLPMAERIGRETVTLPLFPTMKNEDVHRVCTALTEVLSLR